YQTNTPMGRGGGIWDVSPFVVHQNSGSTSPRYYLTTGSLSGQTVGYYPDRVTVPRVSSAIVTAWGTAPPGTLGTYPLMEGNTIYSVVDWNSGTLTNLFTRSAHIGYSYGQNLTTSNVTGLAWSAKGQSYTVSMDSGSLSWMFPGLVISLATDTTNKYVVVGVHPKAPTGATS